MAEPQVVLVTGATDGLGRALVEDFSRCGTRVAFCGRTPSKLDALRRAVEPFGADAYGEAFDLTDLAAISAFVRRVHARFGRIDALINNAGVMYLAPVAEAGSGDIAEMIDVNLKAPLHFITEVLPIFKAQRSGDIVNVSSISARILGPGVVAYSTTKRALDHFTEGLRREVADAGIRVMSLDLGAVATGLNDKIRHDGMRKLIKLRARAYVPMSPADVVEAVKLLLATKRTLCVANMFLVPASQAL